MLRTTKPVGISALLLGLVITLGCDQSGPGPSPDAPSTEVAGAATPTTAAHDPGDDYWPPAPDAPLPPRVDRIRSDLGEYVALIQAGRFGPARIRLRQHLERRPDDGQAEFLFGLSQYLEAQYARAQPRLERAARLEPGYPVTFANLGWCYYYLADLERASASFRHFLRFETDGVGAANAFFALGIIELDRANDEAAEAWLTQAVDAFSASGGAAMKDRGKAHARLGELYLRNERYESAREELSQAVVMWPEHYDAHFMLYRALLRLGEEDQAAIALQRYEEAKAAFERNKAAGG